MDQIEKSAFLWAKVTLSWNPQQTQQEFSLHWPGALVQGTTTQSGVESWGQEVSSFLLKASHSNLWSLIYCLLQHNLEPKTQQYFSSFSTSCSFAQNTIWVLVYLDKHYSTSSNATSGELSLKEKKEDTGQAEDYWSWRKHPVAKNNQILVWESNWKREMSQV